MELRESIIKKLSEIIHPEHKEDIISLNMVSSINEDEKSVSVVLQFRRKNDPMASAVRKMVELAVKDVAGSTKKVDVTVLNPPEKEAQPVNLLEKVRNIIAVASGKGGVGKSTVSVNLAVSLAKRGYKVGLLDADLYGPSIPKMFGLEGYQPEIIKTGNREAMVPAEKFNVKVLSIGFFLDPAKALIWRGPMATSAVKNLLQDTEWGELDFLLIDLPPGTNDIHLTLVQNIGLSGAVIVTTPQMVAVADAVKGVDMFMNENINVPVIGIVENMSWFTPDDSPDKKYFIFGKGGAAHISESMKIPLLGTIPVNETICSGGDSGNPAILYGSDIIKREIEEMTSVFLEKFTEISKKHSPHKVEIKKS